MSRGSNPDRWFSVLQHSDRLWTTPPHPSLLFPGYLNLFPPGRGKRPELGANYTSPLVQRLGMSGAVPSLPLYAVVSCKGTSLSLPFSLFLLMTALLPFCGCSADFLSLLLLFPSVYMTAVRISSVSPATSSKPPDSCRQTARQLQSFLQSVGAFWRLLAGLTATGAKHWSFSFLFKLLSTVH